MTKGYQLDHLLTITQTLKAFFDNVFLEHGGLPHVIPLSLSCAEQVEGVILSHFYSLSFLVRGAHEILVTAQSPISPFHFWI